MAETPDDLMIGSEPTDRGMARALLQRRIETSMNHPDWDAAMRMARGLSPKGTGLSAIEVEALVLLENRILSLSDLVRRLGEESGRQDAR